MSGGTMLNTCRRFLRSCIRSTYWWIAHLGFPPSMSDNPLDAKFRISLGVAHPGRWRKSIHTVRANMAKPTTAAVMTALMMAYLRDLRPPLQVRDLVDKYAVAFCV